MKILAIEPYYGGSHKAFIDGWQQNSVHEWTLVTLPSYKWKWRMRHSPLTCARIVQNMVKSGQNWDVLFVSDMIHLPELCGLLPPQLSSLPRVIYFHENQLTYPIRQGTTRDYHYAYSNFTSCTAANEVWFNTAWHREVFLHGLEAFLRRMPDYKHVEELNLIRNKSKVFPQGICVPPERPPRKPGPMRLIWAARWEYDKNPGDFYGALSLLQAQNTPFEISVIGESFKDCPRVFELIKTEFSSVINYWGFQESREDYYRALQEADICITTAHHEFFGVGLMEAASCGTIPLAPERLAYPEVLRGNGDFLYDNTARALFSHLTDLSGKINTEQWPQLMELARNISSRFFWETLAPKLDDAIFQTANHALTGND